MVPCEHVLSGWKGFSMPRGPAGPAPSAAPAGLASVALAASLAAAGPYNRAGLQFRV